MEESRYILVFACEFNRLMRRQQKRKRSKKAISKDRFPVGELARRRKEIQTEYLNNCEALQTEGGKNIS